MVGEVIFMLACLAACRTLKGSKVGILLNLLRNMNKQAFAVILMLVCLTTCRTIRSSKHLMRPPNYIRAINFDNQSGQEATVSVKFLSGTSDNYSLPDG